MRVPASMEHLVGEWTGTKRLWLAAGLPSLDSAGTARVSRVGGGHFLSVSYEWVHEGTGQEGLLLLQCNEGKHAGEASWVDSFHMSGSIMMLRGQYAGGILNVLGSYPAPPGPDWGWRIIVDASDPARLRILMDNVSPAGQSDRAVEAEFTRRS
ncbi:MAG: hypothetical protein JWL60_1235 [Gemmatimonadetes bacterium]|jgi:hypothetical protein|nr:hypothetical protein [Gemmatimonadota bacterium]